MAYQGVVKSFNGAKGYGFITQEDGTDIFVHEKDCGGASPQAGDTVTFDVEDSPNKPGTYVAKNISGCTGTPEGKGGKGGKGGGKGQGTGQYQGTVKSFVEAKGYGFINHEAGDVFFHARDMVDGSIPDRGDVVRYDVEDNPGKPGTLKATNIAGGSKGKGQGKGKDFGGKGVGFGKSDYGKGGYGAAPAWGMAPWAGAAWGPYGGAGGGWCCGGKAGGYAGKGKSCKGGW